MHRYRLLSIAPTAGLKWTKQGVSGMTNHEYLKQQSPEWLAAKLAEIMDCDCCPAAVYCAKRIETLRELGISECKRTLENWLNAERRTNE